MSKTVMQSHLEWLKSRIIVTPELEELLLEIEKQQFIDFAEWLNDNCQLKSSLPKNIWYYVDSDSNRHRLTTKQLFQEYLKRP